MAKHDRERGYTLLEFIFVVGLMATIAGIAIPEIANGVADFRAAGAVRYLTARLQRTRLDAVSRSVNAAMRFTKSGAVYTYGIYVDGNGDGVRSADIDRGSTDRFSATNSSWTSFRVWSSALCRSFLP